MDWLELLNNMLSRYAWLNWIMGVIIGVIISIVGTYFAQKLLQTRQLKIEYVIRNVEKTYIPIYGEMSHIDNFIRNLFTEYHLLSEFTISKYENTEWNKLEKQGLDEIIRIHDKDLYDRLNHFYKNTLPQLIELNRVLSEVHEKILSAWTKRLTEITEKLHTFVFPSKEDYESASRTIYERFYSYLHKGQVDVFKSKLNEWFKSKKAGKYKIPDQKVIDSVVDDLIKIATDEIENLKKEQKNLIDLIKKDNVESTIKQVADYIGKPWKENIIIRTIRKML